MNRRARAEFFHISDDEREFVSIESYDEFLDDWTFDEQILEDWQCISSN